MPRLRIAPVLAAVALVAAAAPASADRDGCEPKGSDTLAANSLVRVYDLRGVAYGCAYSRGRSYELGLDEFECYAGGCSGLDGRPRVAGRFVAYSLFATDGGSEETTTGEMLVRDLETGRYRHDHPVGDFEADATVGGFRVTRSGAVGYVVDRSPGARRDRDLEVWRMDRRGRKRLAHGTAIDAGSLRLRRGRLSWLEGGRRRSASLR